jgi:hypothetical protein
MKLLILTALLLLSSCSFFESAKKPVVKKASTIAKELSVKHLGCSTGDAVYADVEKQLNKMLKVKDEGYKSIGGTLCILAVGPVVAELVDLGNKELPESWTADGCSLDGFSGDASDLANKLCDKL